MPSIYPVDGDSGKSSHLGTLDGVSSEKVQRNYRRILNVGSRSGSPPLSNESHLAACGHRLSPCVAKGSVQCFGSVANGGRGAIIPHLLAFSHVSPVCQRQNAIDFYDPTPALADDVRTRSEMRRDWRFS